MTWRDVREVHKAFMHSTSHRTNILNRSFKRVAIGTARRSTMRWFLPDEPAELELGVVELADGTSALSMVLRRSEAGKHKDISEHGGWRKYRESLV